jgi:hypothetical protein
MRARPARFSPTALQNVYARLQTRGARRCGSGRWHDHNPLPDHSRKGESMTAMHWMQVAALTSALGLTGTAVAIDTDGTTSTDNRSSASSPAWTRLLRVPSSRRRTRRWGWARTTSMRGIETVMSRHATACLQHRASRTATVLRRWMKMSPVRRGPARMYSQATWGRGTCEVNEPR